jgi:hypothetical protein
MACTSRIEHPTKKYVLMDVLWKENALKEKVIESLGRQYKDANEGIIYERPSSNSIESGHFFNKTQKLTEQFIFLDEASFLDFKKVIPCSWNESEEMKAVGHTVYTVKKGSCVIKNISYEFKPGNTNYEIRWKKE